MKKVFPSLLKLIFIINLASCGSDHKTEIMAPSDNDIKTFVNQEQNFSQKIEKFLLQKKNPKSLSLNPSSVEGLSELVEDWMRPDHLENFESDDLKKHQDQDAWLKFLGNYGRCHQFRVFYKVEDPLFTQNKWMSSIFNLPSSPHSTHNESDLPALVLAPTLDGPNYLLEPAFWSFLCNSKMASLMPEATYHKAENGEWTKKDFDPSPDVRSVDDLTIFRDSLKRYVYILEKNRDLLKSINNLPTNHEKEFFKDLPIYKVSQEKHGLWASSLGSFASSILLAQDESLKGAVLGVGGGDLPYILSQSQIKVFQETRKIQMEHFGLQSESEYQTLLQNHIDFDPLHFARADLNTKIFMYLADQDTSVPTKSQYRLWEAFGKPDMQNLNRGHVGALLYVAWVSREIKAQALEKLQQNLFDENPEGTP